MGETVSLLSERLRTALQEPAHVYARNVVQELRLEVAKLRRENLALRAEAQFRERIVREQRELLRQAQPCPACVAKGE